MMLTQNGKLLYISDNAAEYLGHSMVSNFFKFLTSLNLNMMVRTRRVCVCLCEWVSE